MVRFPEVCGVVGDGDEGAVLVVGHRLVDEFLRFAASRARPNTVRAYAHDLKTFFAIVGKVPVDVRAKDVLGFIAVQQRARVGAENVARISDGGSGLSVATIRRRLAAVSAFYGYLIACGDAGVETNPVPRGLPTRRRRRDGRGQPLVRAVRRLPRILEPGEVAALMAVLRTARDRAMVQAMVLGVCAAAKCSGCGSRISGWVNGGCSSLMARAAINGWCRCRRPSSRRSLPTWMPSGRRVLRRIECSSC
jgi:integrase/recombinase XerD